jgi:methionine-rich copper-binding protein CopC
MEQEGKQMTRIIKVILGISLTGLLAINPVFAHTDLISVEPATDQVMLTLPSEVKLTFGESVIAEGTFASITTAAGSVETTVRVEAANVYVAIPADLVGPDVTIFWKTVASDGHPLDGETVYKLAEARDEPTPEVTALEEPVAISAPLQENSSNISWLQWLSLGASIGIAITFFLKMRKK